MMQLIHSRKALETDPIAYMQELQEFPITLEEVFTIKGSIFNQDKIAEQLTKLKTMVKKGADIHVPGVNFVECAGG
jgi:hypothetical protein